jgi:hypothetical protein
MAQYVRMRKCEKKECYEVQQREEHGWIKKIQFRGVEARKEAIAYMFKLLWQIKRNINERPRMWK